MEPAEPAEPAEVATRISEWTKRSTKKMFGGVVVAVTLVAAFVYGVTGVDKLSRVPKEGIQKVAKDTLADILGTKMDDLQENCKNCAEYSKDCVMRMTVLMRHLKLQYPKDLPKEEKNKGEIALLIPYYQDRVGLVILSYLLWMRKMDNSIPKSPRKVKMIEPSIVLPKPRILLGNASSVGLYFEDIYRSGEPRRAYDCVSAYD